MSPKSILYVDDDKDSCDLVSFVLERAGFQVKTALTWKDGWSFLCNECFDLYLLDDWLPDAEGLGIAAQIRGSGSRTPIIFCSADTRESSRQALLNAGAQAFISKPITIETFAATIARQLAEGESN